MVNSHLKMKVFCIMNLVISLKLDKYKYIYIFTYLFTYLPTLIGNNKNFYYILY